MAAVDSLGGEPVGALFAPDAELLLADGRHARGRDAVTAAIGEIQATLREARHEITNSWHVDDVWIAEVRATYVLRDWHELRDVPRAFIAREGAEGITELRCYGANEPSMAERMNEEEMRIGGRLMMPL